MTTVRSFAAQLVVVAAVLIVSLWGSTQWAAHMLDYQPALGAPWCALFGLPIYAPANLLSWWLTFGDQAPDAFNRAGAAAAFGGLLSGIVAIGGNAWRASQSTLVTTFGSARWADVRDVADAGALADQGLILGLYDDRYLRHDGPEHVMAVAPTRSGKGVPR